MGSRNNQQATVSGVMLASCQHRPRRRLRSATLLLHLKVSENGLVCWGGASFELLSCAASSFGALRNTVQNRNNPSVCMGPGRRSRQRKSFA